MKLRDFRVQESYEYVGSAVPGRLARVDLDAVGETVRYPLVWAHDELLGCALPAEIDMEFEEWVRALPSEFELADVPPGRVKQLLAANLIESPHRPTREALRASMAADGFVRIPQLFNGQYAAAVADYFRRNEHRHERHRDMEGIRRTSARNLPLMRLLHEATLYLVQSLVPEPIKTTYSFAAQYEAGSILPKHTDNSQCAYNVSLMLDVEGVGQAGDWLLNIQRPGLVHHVPLDAGDGVLYSGTRDAHWRDAMPASLKSAVGVFFHYVPASYTGSLD